MYVYLEAQPTYLEHKIRIQIWLAIYRKCHLIFNSKCTVNVTNKMEVDWLYSEIGWKMANGPTVILCSAYPCFTFLFITLPILNRNTDYTTHLDKMLVNIF